MTTLPLIPGLRPDPEPGERQWTFKSRANAILDHLDRIDNTPVTNRELRERFKWGAQVTRTQTRRMARGGLLMVAGRTSTALLYHRPPI